jgi:hypothetical protein
MSLVTWAGFGPFAQVCRTKSPQHWSQKPGHETGSTIIGGPPVTTCPRDTSHDEPSSEVAVLDHSTNFLFQCIEFCSIRQLFGMGRGPRFHPLGVDFGHGRVFWMGSGGKPPSPINI